MLNQIQNRIQDHILLQKIKEAVQILEPTAQIFLYGSRARNDAKPSSDWDIIILVDDIVTPSRVNQIRHRIYEIEWETDTIICSIVRSKQEWHSPKLQQTPFHKLVTQDAILL